MTAQVRSVSSVPSPAAAADTAAGDVAVPVGPAAPHLVAREELGGGTQEQGDQAGPMWTAGSGSGWSEVAVGQRVAVALFDAVDQELEPMALVAWTVAL